MINLVFPDALDHGAVHAEAALDDPSISTSHSTLPVGDIEIDNGNDLAVDAVELENALSSDTVLSPSVLMEMYQSVAFG